MKLVSVVLSGGAGTRLWPVSRQALPKPFMSLRGSTLLEQSIQRGLDCGADETLIVTNENHQFLSSNVIQGMSGPPPVSFLLEPAGRNTAPAIALAALACAERHGPDTVMLVLPADHLIPDTQAFVACALEAARHAAAGQLVVFGVPPTSPETGFGYIEVAQPSRDSQKVLRFVEKPDLPTALAYVSGGRHYWNSGMFCFTAASILTAFGNSAPRLLAAAEATWQSATGTPTVTKFDAATFAAQPDISIDYAVMESAPNVTVVPSRFGWSDVGSWPAVASALPGDSSGNTCSASAGVELVNIDTSGTHIHVESHGPKVVATVGVQDLVVVDTPDALLVAHKSKAQHVKMVVDSLRARNNDTATQPADVQRPWGTYVTIKEEGGYKVKRISVKPGQALSLQFHHQRAEHWVLVQGRAMIQIGETEYETTPGQYRYIPLGEKHRLRNIGADDVVFIEVQCGEYLGEDDIIRLADSYGRA